MQNIKPVMLEYDIEYYNNQIKSLERRIIKMIDRIYMFRTKINEVRKKRKVK